MVATGRNAHEQTPEELLLATENDKARTKQFIELGIAVVMQAIQDATATIPDLTPEMGKMKKERVNRAREARQEARTFLLTENDMLRFWCYVAGIDHRILLSYSRNAQGRWETLGRWLRESGLNRRNAVRREVSLNVESP